MLDKYYQGHVGLLDFINVNTTEVYKYKNTNEKPDITVELLLNSIKNNKIQLTSNNNIWIQYTMITEQYTCSIYIPMLQVYSFILLFL